MKISRLGVFLILLCGVVNFSCQSTLDLIQNVQRLKFKLGSVNNFSLAGVSLSNKRSISDFSVADALSLTQAFANNRLPAGFTLNVLAKNPNDGTGGTPRTTTTMTKMAWRLLIDNTETINGNIEQEVQVPGVGQEVTIPINMSLDLFTFFKNLGYEGIVNLALALGGVNGSSSRITLKATPTMVTAFGPLSSGEITVVDTEFR
jgi:hypothetical protein